VLESAIASESLTAGGRPAEDRWQLRVRGGAVVRDTTPEGAGALGDGVPREGSRRGVRRVLPGPWLLVGFVVVLVANGVLLRAYYDRYWYPPDEGIYAHIAERVLGGEVLNRDIQDLHPGYIHLVNAAAFRVFGVDLVSLRYPIVALSLLQACLVYLLLMRKDLLLAVAASLALTGLGFVQFLNPTTHWYCLFAAVTLIGWMTWTPQGSAARLIGAGAIVGVATLFRQLTGVWLAMAVLTLCLHEAPTGAASARPILGRALVVVMAAATLAYLSVTHGATVGGMLLFASGPLGILFVVFTGVRASDREVARLLWRFGLGVLAGMLPLLTYHAVHGSVGVWLDDTLVAAVGLTQLEFFHGGWFSLLSVAGLHQALSSVDAVRIVNGLFWAVLPLIPAANALLIWRAHRDGAPPCELVLPVIAAFYALVSLHLEGPVYLSYTIGLSLVAVLWGVSRAAAPVRRVVAGAAVAVIAVAVTFHAAQSYVRTPRQTLAGERTLTPRTPLCVAPSRASLRIERTDCQPYMALTARIKAETSPDQTMLAVPNDPELYFLSQRRNPFGFYNTAFGVRSEADLHAVLAVLTAHPPRVVTYRPGDKYNTAASRQIMQHVRASYDRFDAVDGVELYRPRVMDGTASAGPSEIHHRE
jgi:hypothetical protein